MGKIWGIEFDILRLEKMRHETGVCPPTSSGQYMFKMARQGHFKPIPSSSAGARKASKWRPNKKYRRVNS
jgi:hypothetical protein